MCSQQRWSVWVANETGLRMPHNSVILSVVECYINELTLTQRVFSGRPKSAKLRSAPKNWRVLSLLIIHSSYTSLSRIVHTCIDITSTHKHVHSVTSSLFLHFLVLFIIDRQLPPSIRMSANSSQGNATFLCVLYTADVLVTSDGGHLVSSPVIGVVF